MNRRVGIRALPGQCGELVHGQIRSGLRLIARHVRLRQLAFGLPQFELGIDARGDAAARDGDDIFALRGRALRDVRQGVFPIQLYIGLRDGRAEHEPRVLDIQRRGVGQGLGAMHRVGLPSRRNPDPNSKTRPPGPSRKCVRRAAAE